ncbi:MAG: hypothetical protein HUJ68_11290, partial [Clostridia bacterium]|nr:hypothetical protein [Clostridia bacterium]
TINTDNIKTTEDVESAVFTLSLWSNTDTPTADDFEFTVVSSNSITSDCGFFLELASDKNDAIMWLASNKQFFAGTEENVWNLPSGINAIQIAAEQNGRYGSDNVQAQVIDTAIVFFSQGKMAIREHYLSSETGAFMTNNLALHANQMLEESKVYDFDYITNPFNSLIITREDGNIVKLLYDKNNGVMGWNRLIHGNNKIKSVAVVRGDGPDDIIYISVKDGENFYLEKILKEQNVFLDSWKVYTGRSQDLSEYDYNKAIIWNNTTKLEWKVKDLQNMPDDWIHPNDKVYVGYKYKSLIKSLPVIANEINAKKRIVNLYVRFLNSYMPIVKTTGMSPEYFNGTVQPFNGVKKIDFPGTSEIDVDFEISIEEPEECNVLSVDATMA